MGQEKSFENRIKKFLDKNGAYEVKYFANAFTPKGVPDVLACLMGNFLGIEVKARGGKPSPIQIYNLKCIDAAGGYAILLYPDDYVIFVDFINKIRQDDYDKAEKIYSVLKEGWEKWERELLEN